MFILRDSRCGKLVKELCNNKSVYTGHFGNAIKFPTSDEADFYVEENGWNWNDFLVERYG
jgi:hypothetical protein